MGQEYMTCKRIYNMNNIQGCLNIHRISVSSMKSNSCCVSVQSTGTLEISIAIPFIIYILCKEKACRKTDIL